MCIILVPFHRLTNLFLPKYRKRYIDLCKSSETYGELIEVVKTHTSVTRGTKYLIYIFSLSDTLQKYIFLCILP